MANGDHDLVDVEQVERGSAPINIGRPIANTQVYILDAAGEIAPIGVTGEICIGGQGWRSVITSARFDG